MCIMNYFASRADSTLTFQFCIFAWVCITAWLEYNAHENMLSCQIQCTNKTLLLCYFSDILVISAEFNIWKYPGMLNKWNNIFLSYDKNLIYFVNRYCCIWQDQFIFQSFSDCIWQGHSCVMKYDNKCSIFQILTMQLNKMSFSWERMNWYSSVLV